MIACHAMKPELEALKAELDMLIEQARAELAAIRAGAPNGPPRPRARAHRRRLALKRGPDLV
jgi:hypothetical protein